MDVRRVFAILGAGALLAVPTMPMATRANASTLAAATQSWVQWDAAHRTARLTITAAYNQTGGGFNFDGYNLGHLTITVPVGAKVVVSFTNKAALPHSAVITPFTDRALAGNFPVAFKGSASSNPSAGAASLSTPQVFSFVANKVGTYALVCGVPGHAIGGMWDRFVVAKVSSASQQIAGAAPTGSGSGKPASSGNSLGAMEGTITDASTGKPLPHVYVVLGWTTLKRVGETDAKGHYRIDNVKPISLTDAYGFAEGYVYYHGHPVPIKAGQVTTYSFAMPRNTFTKDLLPRLTGASLSTTTAKPGATVTFQAHITPGKNGPLSAENFAVNTQMGHSVLLTRVGSTTYRGTWQIPADTKPGAYQFIFIATMQNCLENAPYARLTLNVHG
jgi:sulfocyanin